MVYSPLDAVELARQQPDRQIVFFAVGFETTAPATALAVKQAAALDLSNFSVLVSHVRVQPAMEKLLQMRDVRIDGFLAAGHVCTIAGYQTYDSLAENFGVPVIVTGFEPVDLLSGILACVSQLEAGKGRAELLWPQCAQARKPGSATTCRRRLRGLRPRLARIRCVTVGWASFARRVAHFSTPLRGLARACRRSLKRVIAQVDSCWPVA